MAADIITRYEDYLIEIKHASNNTVSSYMRDIHQYASYLLTLGTDVLEATQRTIAQPCFAQKPVHVRAQRG